MASTPPLTGRTLLAVFAHPDDESLVSGGVLAWCAALGARVVLLCASHGEHGPNPDLAQPLAPRRAAELDAAARSLGIDEVILLNHEDGMLPWVDDAAIDADISAAILRVRPDVVVTFDEDGLYWHPDHIAIHDRTTAVVAALGATAPALYYAAMPVGAMRAVHDAALGRRTGGEGPLRILGIADPDAFGASAPAATLVLDASAFAERKLAALRCHRSQLTDDALELLTQADAHLLGIEHYRRAPVGAPGDTFLEHLADARIPA